MVTIILAATTIETSSTLAVAITPTPSPSADKSPSITVLKAVLPAEEDVDKLAYTVRTMYTDKYIVHSGEPEGEMMSPEPICGSAENHHPGTFSPYDYGVVVTMLVISIGIGVFYGFFHKVDDTSSTFNLHLGQGMQLFPVTLSLTTSFITAIELLGNPSEIFFHGTQYSIIGICYSNSNHPLSWIYFGINWKLWHSSSLHHPGDTCGNQDILSHLLQIGCDELLWVSRNTFRFEYQGVWRHAVHNAGEWVRKLICIFEARCKSFNYRIIRHPPQMTFYTSVAVLAPAIALSKATGLNTRLAVILIYVVCIFYSSQGGMKAVVIADTFQVSVLSNGGYPRTLF